MKKFKTFWICLILAFFLCSSFIAAEKQVVVKIAASCYQLQVEKKVNIIWFINELASHGGNAMEVFINFTWPLAKKKPWCSYDTSGWKFSPYKRVGWRTEKRYGDYPFPVFDLEQWNEDTWDRLKLIFTECQRNGITLFIRVQDYCSIRTPFYKRHHPYFSNIQETDGIWSDSNQKYDRLFNAKLIDTLEEAKLHDFFIIPQSESDVYGDHSEEEKDQMCIKLNQDSIDNFLDLGVRQQQIIISTDRKGIKEHFKAQGLVIEEHKINSPESLKKRYQEEGDAIFPNGDGYDPFAEGTKGCNGNGEPSYSQAIEMGKIIKRYYGYFLRSIERAPWDVSVLYADFTALIGLIEGLKIQAQK